MVDFWVYDVTFLVLFSILVFWFIKNNKESLSKEGIIYMYRTSLGIKAINYVGDKFKRTLSSLRYPVIGLGIILMATMLWMLTRTLSIYTFNPEITQVIKAPPIAPLIPYFPKLFGMSSFFPPFYFTYFIIALAIVAVAHEFSHGIFMRRFKVKIKSTGLVFLGPIIGAFVEEEKSNFEKKKKVEQMTVLGAGVFANIIFSIVFYGVYVLFFFLSFSASGYRFTSYSMSSIPVSDITGFETQGNLTGVITGNGTHYLDENLALQLKIENITNILVYDDAPAVKAGMKGAIIRGDNFDINNVEDLREFLSEKSPGERVTFTTYDGEKTKEYTVVLAEHPQKIGKAFLGVGHSDPKPKGIIQKLFVSFMAFKEPSTRYEASYNKDLALFFLNLFWWIMIINLLVALFNMLPLGMLDGGRFFYLLVLGITRSEKLASKAFKYMGYAILLSFILMMLFWGFRVF